MTVNFLRASQTYNAEQKRNKSGGIGKRVASYDNTFYTDLDVSTPFSVAEILICKFIDDVLLYNHLDEEEKWQYCNLQMKSLVKCRLALGSLSKPKKAFMLRHTGLCHPTTLTKSLSLI